MKAFINCDMGEGMPNDAALMPFIQAANIACGYHAGDAGTMRQTILLAKEYGVAAGAHPSFRDRENFGRKEMPWDEKDIYECVCEQVYLLREIAGREGVKLRHVKPHGALYNMSARDPLLAAVIARAVADIDKDLLLFGLSGSHSIREAKKAGLQTASEVFADRSYQEDGSLTPRNQPGAVWEDTGNMIAQVLQMVNEGTVTTVTGKTVPIVADTICIHGDGAHALEFAAALHRVVTENREP